MQSRWESVRILLGKHIISQPRRGDEAIESNGEETSISMQPFPGFAVILTVLVIADTYRLSSTANLLKGLALSRRRLLSRMIGFAAEYSAMF